MKKILVAVAILFSLFTFANSHHTDVNNESSYINNSKTDSVYICNSSTAYVYHSTPNCKGLNRCTHGVIKVSLYDATHSYGRRACKLCE